MKEINVRGYCCEGSKVNVRCWGKFFKEMGLEIESVVGEIYFGGSKGFDCFWKEGN